MLNSFLRLSSSLLLFCSQSLIYSQDSKKFATELRDHVRTVETAENWTDEKAAFQNLFNFVGADRLETISKHNNVSVALQATWERLWNEVEKSDQNCICPPVEERKLNGFLETVQKKVGFKIPDWWMGSLKLEPQYTPTNIGLIETVSGVEIERRQNDFFLNVGKQRVQIPSSIIPKDYKKQPIRMASTFTDSKCFVAFHANYSGNLYCIDRESGRIDWQADFLTGSLIALGGYMPPSVVDVQTRDNEVMVFARFLGYALEGYQISDGSSKFKFTTNNRWHRTK